MTEESLFLAALTGRTAAGSLTPDDIGEKYVSFTNTHPPRNDFTQARRPEMNRRRLLCGGWLRDNASEIRDRPKRNPDQLAGGSTWTIWDSSPSLCRSSSRR